MSCVYVSFWKKKTVPRKQKMVGKTDEGTCGTKKKQQKICDMWQTSFSYQISFVFQQKKTRITTVSKNISIIA